MDFKVTVTHSLISAHSIRSLLASYEIADVISCDFLTRGLNDSYVITTDSVKYIFRVYRHNWRSESDILFEIDALNYFKKAGIPVSSPINTVEGNWVIALHAPEGIRYGVLFTYSPGERPVISEANCFTIGRSLAELHKHSSSFHSAHRRNFDLDMQHLLDEPLTYLSPVLEKVLHRENSLKDIVEKIKSEFSGIKLEYGFCHGDFHNFNMHIDDQKLEVFDFDCCGFGYRAYDIAVFWWNLKNNYPNQEKACWDEFLNGYLSKKNIQEADLKSLSLFISVRRIWLLGTMIKNEDVWGTNWINETNLNRFFLDIEQDQQQYTLL
ncbi:phosphotransferase enzyme family protein [Neobacillus vireti]|uniref:Aminoglycoside phosphotransferase n=1 Tax=Neobacillus vireti LMG 21834 TaxID=1131730 RepID=A0AB94IGE2_9BACI|nr:phosphotransferase [Neobacillus vireti]ETI66180.1 aminoglycoside phosphotransferase [Neobacillus vireti LMG 21834]KLT18273.1 hypothetical protein AA980_08050 [Neobacillus vireti]